MLKIRGGGKEGGEKEGREGDGGGGERGKQTTGVATLGILAFFSFLRKKVLSMFFLCSPCCPGARYIDQPGLQNKQRPACTFLLSAGGKGLHHHTVSKEAYAVHMCSFLCLARYSSQRKKYIH